MFFFSANELKSYKEHDSPLILFFLRLDNQYAKDTNKSSSVNLNNG